MLLVRPGISTLGLVVAIGIVSLGCSQKDSIDVQVDAVLASKAKTAFYPIYKSIDPGSDGAPFDVTVYGSYAYARVPSNPQVRSLSITAASAKLNSAIQQAVSGVQELEKEFPAPKTTPTRPEWKKVPHAEAGTYSLFVKGIGDVPIAPLSTSPNESSSQLSEDIRRASDALIAGYARAEAERMASASSTVPPGGFSVSSDQMVAANAASRGSLGDPFLSGGGLLLLPVDAAKAIARLKRTVVEETLRTQKANSKLTGASIIIEGPVGEFRFKVPFPSGNDQSRAIDEGLAPVATALDALNKGSK